MHMERSSIIVNETKLKVWNQAPLLMQLHILRGDVHSVPFGHMGRMLIVASL